MDLLRDAQPFVVHPVPDRLGLLPSPGFPGEPDGDADGEGHDHPGRSQESDRAGRGRRVEENVRHHGGKRQPGSRDRGPQVLVGRHGVHRDEEREEERPVGVHATTDISLRPHPYVPKLPSTPSHRRSTTPGPAAAANLGGVKTYERASAVPPRRVVVIGI